MRCLRYLAFDLPQFDLGRQEDDLHLLLINETTVTPQ